MIEEIDLSFLDFNSIMNTIKSIKLETHGLIENGYSSYNIGMPILEHQNLIGLKMIILKYINSVSSKELKLINSWFNITYPGGILKKHKHENSIISGAFYVKVGENSTPLIFPNKSIKPKNGLLVIFSSELEHYTEEEKEERIVISFNSDYL
jgi:Putative 2OG-Fe(II) oxygenase